MDPLLSTQTTLLLAMGMGAYVGLLHVGYARKVCGPHGWVALWSFFAVASQAGRLVHLHTRDPFVAVMAARWYAAMAPLLIGSLCGFVQSLSGRPPRRRRWAFAFVAAKLVLSLAIFGTELFVTSSTYVKQDWAGAIFLGVRVEP